MADARPVESLTRWSTRDVDPSQRLEYYADALSQAVDPMSIASAGASFHAEVCALPMGGTSIIRATGAEHRCVRTERDVARAAERNLHLILNRRSDWTLSHRGDVRLRAGDAVLLDSRYRHCIDLPSFEIVHLRLSEAWCRRWLPNPERLAGHVFRRDASWSAALCGYVAQLSPELFQREPLPRSLILDHVGALLALVADERGLRSAAVPPRDDVLRAKLVGTIRERCTDPGLRAEDVARAVNVSVRTLHRCLARVGSTFGAELQGARVQLGVDLLRSKSFARQSIGDLAARAGFSDASHFARAVRARTGRTPGEIRRG
jgi:AraC-like DNA-binding protein